MKHRIPLLLVFTGFVLSACTTQTYEPRPIDPARLAASFNQRSLVSAELRNYMLAQGYPENAFPIKQWGLQELTLAAFLYHPQLEVARAQLRAAQAAEITAGQRPNPELSGTLEHHSKTDGGISPWTYGISLSIPVETGGKRQARIDQATGLSEAARIDIARIAWQLRSHLRDSLQEYQTLLRKIDLLQQEVALHEEIVQMLDNRLKAGVASSIELNHARLQLQKALHAAEAEKGQVAGLRATVAAAAGLPTSALDSVQFNTALPDIGIASTRFSNQDIRRAALLNSLDIRSALARYNAAEASLRLEIAKQYPDITLAPGYLWDQGDLQWSLAPSLILALMNRNEGPIAEARARREVQASQFVALQSRLIGELEQSYISYAAASERLAKAQQVLESQRSRTAMIAHQFDAGHTDRLEMAGARLETLVAQQGVLEAEINTQRALYTLEDAVQQPLDGSAPLLEIPQETPAHE